MVGGVIVLRSGTNARAAIAAVKTKLQALKPGLPDGVELSDDPVLRFRPEAYSVSAERRMAELVC